MFRESLTQGLYLSLYNSSFISGLLVLSSTLLYFWLNVTLFWESHESLKHIGFEFVSDSSSGDAVVGKDVKPLDATLVSSEVWYGKEKGNYTLKKKGNATVYSQLYPFDGLLNYTSGIIHHVLIDGTNEKRQLWPYIRVETSDL